MSFKKGVSSWNKGIKIKPEVRFWKFIEKTDYCWNWKGGRSGNGYGYFSEEWNHQVRAHRFSYELHKGKIPEGMVLCHACDNKICVNPEHLWVGTSGDNTRDAVKKGLMGGGEANPNSHLTWRDVKRIRELYATNEYSQKSLGSMFGVCQVQVGEIVRHKSWITIPAGS